MTERGSRTVFLIDACSPLERKLLEGWIAENAAGGEGNGVEAIVIPPSRRGSVRESLDPRLEARLATGDDPLLAPLRVAWHPPRRDGVHRAALRDLLTLGDPRDPGRLRQEWVLRRHPERCSVVVAEPAPASALRERWRSACGSDAGQTTGLAEFVVRQAGLALERAERRLRGARYKVPRFVNEEILSRPAFQGGVARIAHEAGMSAATAERKAAAYLGEIAASHSTHVIDLVSTLIKRMYTLGYSEALDYDHGKLKEIFALGQRFPVVFLPSHKSNLDHLVLQYALHENGHPPNHTAGGINMNFFPLGPLFRRSGVFFIRRTFKDNPLYKFVLRQYVDYLVEKRFSLEWYIEGGRSRSGKLLPPRMGILGYVVDAYRRGKSEDVYLIPVSIAYDQITDVGDYVAEQRGAAKQKESFGWFLGVVRKLRHRYGHVHINFGEPLSLRQALGPADPEAPPSADDGERDLTLQKLAFEVSVRINRATPITATSLLTLALLGAGDRAVSIGEIRMLLRNLLDYLRKRELPTTDDFDLSTPEAVTRVLESLEENGVVSCFAEGAEPVYMIGADQHLTAAYYRNTIIHFFVNGAIAELALLGAAEEGVGDRVAEFWDEAMRLRDLLKFEFFFAEKEVYRQEMRVELAVHDPDWESALAAGPAEIAALVRRIRPFNAHRVLKPFLEGYRVVSDALTALGDEPEIEEAPFLSRCLSLGKQYRLQRRISSAESISKVLFETALRLARNRGLVDPEVPRLAERRRAFAEEIATAVRRVDAVDALAASRRAGLID
jgi:glycerol-3-phosphate O-acyltransferase